MLARSTFRRRPGQLMSPSAASGADAGSVVGVEASVALAPEAASAGTARSLVEDTLRTWQCDELLDDVRVVVSELVSNVVRHAGTGLVVLLEMHPDRLRVAVSDHADGDVVVREADPERDTGGRGLRIVESLSDRWGVSRDGGGKTVWAEWRLPR